MQHRASATPAGVPAHEVALYVLAPGFESVPDARGGLSRLEALLDPSERRRSQQFLRPGDRQRFVVAHALLRLAVADHLGVPAGGAQFDFACERCGEQHGAPRLVGGVPTGTGPVALSLTRSSGVIAVAVLDGTTVGQSGGGRTPGLTDRSGDRHVGVDAERIDAVDFDGFDAVALSERERFLVGEQALRTRAGLWVRKEAIAKALGTGLRRDPRSIEPERDSQRRPVEQVVSRVVELGRPRTAAGTPGDTGLTHHIAALAVWPGTPGEAIVCTVIRAEALVRRALDPSAA